MIKTYKDLKKSIPGFNRFHQSLLAVREVVDTGELSEFYCRKLFRLKRVKPWNAAIDAIDPHGKKVEIKHRSITGKTPAGMKVHLKKIDYLLYVELSKKLLPAKIFKIDAKDITPASGGRVSFLKAFQNGKAQIVFDGCM
ncbi:MAG: hypothetical protein HYT27_03695 [Parcubacteria group bacterium]|nr:hypothetical protein [Parcubacteria group bacterium]